MSVAISYAKALYEAAKEREFSSENLAHIEVQMDSLCSVMDHSKEVQVALISPVTTSREKIALIQEFAQKLGLSQLLSEFLILLIKKRRFSLLGNIREAFGSIRLTLEGGMAGTLVTAQSMSDLEIDALTKVFSHKFGKKVAFRVSADPSLLAGMKVTMNGVTYDGTLRSQLQKLRDRVVSGSPVAVA